MYNKKNRAAPEVASAIWSESAIGGGGVRYPPHTVFSMELGYWQCLK